MQPMADVASSWAQTGAVLTVHRWVAVIGGLLLASLVVLLLCLQFGATSVGMGTVATAIARMLRGDEAGAPGLGTSEIIMVQIRFPRVLMGFLVGASLAAVGVTLQALLRNPLADPYVLGVRADPRWASRSPFCLASVPLLYSCRCSRSLDLPEPSWHWC